MKKLCKKTNKRRSARYVKDRKDRFNVYPYKLLWPVPKPA